MFQRHLHNANDAKTFLKHFSDCLFYFCSTCADCFTHSKTTRSSVVAYRPCDAPCFHGTARKVSISIKFKVRITSFVPKIQNMVTWLRLCLFQGSFTTCSVASTCQVAKDYLLTKFQVSSKDIERYQKIRKWVNEMTFKRQSRSSGITLCDRPPIFSSLFKSKRAKKATYNAVYI